MNANVKVLSIAADQSSSASERAKIVGGLESIAKKIDRLREAEDAETAVRAEFEAHSERDLAATKAWIGSGAEGPQPSVNAKAHRALNEKLVISSAAAKAAKAAAAALAADAARLRDELNQTVAMMAEAALSGLHDR